MSYWEGIFVADEIRILGHDYSIRHVPREELSGDCGDVNYHLSVIRVSRSLSPSQVSSTILHETIETLNDMLNMGLTHDQIDKLEAGWFAVIRDNPDLIRGMLSDG